MRYRTTNVRVGCDQPPTVAGERKLIVAGQRLIAVKSNRGPTFLVLFPQDLVLESFQPEAWRGCLPLEHVIETTAGADGEALIGMIEDEVVVRMALGSAGDFDFFRNARE